MGIGLCIAIVTNGTSLWSSRSTDFGTTWQQAGEPARCVPGSDRPRVRRSKAICLVAGYVPTGAGHGAGALAAERRRRADVGERDGAGRRRVAPKRRLRDLDLVLRRRDDLDDRQRRRSGQGPAPPERRRRSHLDLRAPSPPSTTPTGSPVRAHGSAPWSVPTGPASLLSGRVPWPRATTAVRRSLSSSAAYVPLTLAALSCPTTAACIAVGGDTLARITLQPPATTHARTPTTEQLSLRPALRRSRPRARDPGKASNSP